MLLNKCCRNMFKPRIYVKWQRLGDLGSFIGREAESVNLSFRVIFYQYWIFLLLLFGTTTAVRQGLPVSLLGVTFSDSLITHSRIVSRRSIWGLNPWRACCWVVRVDDGTTKPANTGLRIHTLNSSSTCWLRGRQLRFTRNRHFERITRSVSWSVPPTVPPIPRTRFVYSDDIGSACRCKHYHSCSVQMDSRTHSLSTVCRFCLCRDEDKLIPLSILTDKSLTLQDMELFTWQSKRGPRCTNTLK